MHGRAAEIFGEPLARLVARLGSPLLRAEEITVVLSNSARVRLGLSRAEAAAVLDRPGGLDLPQPGGAGDRA